MHYCICYHGPAHPWAVYASLGGPHICLALVSASLLGVGWRGGFSPHIFTPALWRIWHMLIWLFCFTSYSTACIFDCDDFSSVSDMDIDLMSPLRSWVYFSFSMSPPFLRGFQSGWKVSGSSRVIWLVCPVQSPRGYPLLSLVLRTSDRLSGRVSLGSCLYLGSLWIFGAPKVLEMLLRSVPGNPPPAFFFIFSGTWWE